MEFIALIISYIWPVFILFLLAGCFITLRKIKKPDATIKIARTSGFIVAIIAFLIGTFGFMVFFLDGAPIAVTAIMSLITAVTLFGLIWAFSIFIIRWKRADLNISRSRILSAILVIAFFLVAITPLILNAFTIRKASTTNDAQVILKLYNDAKKKNSRSVLKAIAGNPVTAPTIFYELFENWKGPYPAYDISILCRLEENPNSPEDLLLKLVKEGPGWCLVRNPMIPNKVLEAIIKEKTHVAESSTKDAAIRILRERGVELEK